MHYQSKTGNNAVTKHIQRLRCIAKLAYHMERIKKDPFIKFKPQLEKKRREFLTKAKLQRIENIYLELERLYIVRDIFVFSCYTGILYVNVIALSRKQIITGMDGKIMDFRKKKQKRYSFRNPFIIKSIGAH